MSFSKILDRLFKNGGSGPTVNDGIVAKDISIQPWDSTYDYAGGEIVRGGGSSPSNLILYQAKQASGPNTSAGSKDPANSQNFDYWSVLSITGAVPVGTIIWYSSSTAPVGYLICNGQAVSRTLYPDLFTAIGTTYGAGDGSTTFNLPNLLNKFIEGANSNVGDSVAAGLPNITGSVGWTANSLFSRATGAFTGVDATGNEYVQVDTTAHSTFYKYADFSAANSNSIYGNSNTVQPPAVKLLPCIKAYSDVDNLGSCDVAQLENYVQNNVVHKTGDEVVGGVKSFLCDNSARETTTQTTDLFLTNPTITKSVASTDGKKHYSQIVFLDSTNDDIDNGRVAAIYYHHPEANQTGSARNPYLRLAINTVNESNESVSGALSIFYDKLTQVFAAFCPSTSELRTGGTDIVTRDWIPKDDRIVHTTGIEVITGTKYFVGPSGYSVRIRNSSIDTNSTTNSSVSFSIANKSDIPLAGFGFVNGSDHYSYMSVYNNSSSTGYQLALSYDNKSFAIGGAGNSNTFTLGRAQRLWKQLFAGTATINTSDERLKEDISSIPDEVLDVWEQIDWKQFRFKDAILEKGEENTRFHTGLIAQEIDRLYKSKNLDISKYGLFCYDEWQAEEEMLDDDGKVIREYSPAGNQYSLRYEEALCMEAAYNRREVKRLKEEINLLKQRLDSLENS